MRPLLLIALVSVACVQDLPPPHAPLPSTPPPPPPRREVNATTVFGQVVTSRGTPAAHASVVIHPADPSCRPLAGGVGAVTDPNGQYQMMVEVGVGPAYSGCAVVEARSGGAAGSSSAPAHFVSSDAERRPVRVDVRLGLPPRITPGEAERLVRQLAEAINNEAGYIDPELALYVPDGSEALRIAVDQYRSVLGRVAAVRALPPDWSPLPFELRGVNGRTARVTVEQDDLTRLHSPLLDYGARSERFVNAYVRFLSSGDAERLARLLNPDDIDFPIARARDLVVGYRQRYADLGSLRFSFAGLDEARHTITWRLHGKGVTGSDLVETMVLRYGDGLLGVVEITDASGVPILRP